MQFIRPKTLDRIDIIAVVDNSHEVWSNPRREDVKRFFHWVDQDKETKELPLVAGLGLSFWIRMTLDNRTSNILFDTSESKLHLSTNIKFLGLPLDELDGIVISHGHDDHYGGLRWTLENVHHSIPVYIHPRMLYQKGARVKTHTGEKIVENEPILTAKEISELGGEVVSVEDPILLSDGLLLRTGEIPRVTDYEQGRPGHLMCIDGQWVDDSLVLEDVSLVANVRGKGLVIISGCSHAGIVNIVKEAIRLTGEPNIHAIIGGLHLAGSEVENEREESKLARTTEDLERLNPKMLVPCHCTGWRARHAMSRAMNEAYVEGSVGNQYSVIGQ